MLRCGLGLTGLSLGFVTGTQRPRSDEENWVARFDLLQLPFTLQRQTPLETIMRVTKL